MKKEDRLNLAFAKCLNQQQLTDDECDLVVSLKISDLTSVKHGFNENQARKILLWCQQECQRKGNSYLLDTRETSNIPHSKYYRT